MQRILLVVLILLALLGGLAAGATALVMRDPAYLERFLSNTLGREVTIGGIHNLHLGAESTVVIEDLSIANPSWAKEPSLLQLRRLRIHLQLSSLWRDGPVVINNLDVDGMRLALLEQEGQAPSWSLSTDSSESADPEGPLRLPVLIRQAHLVDSTIFYQDPVREFRAILSGQLAGGEGIQVQLDGGTGGHPITYFGTTRWVGQGLEITGQGSFESWQVSLQGELADPFNFRGVDMALQVEGALPVEGGTETSAEIPLLLDVHLSGSGERMDVERGHLSSGATHVDLSGTLGNPNTLEGLALKLTLESEDIKSLLPRPAVNAEPVPLSFSTTLVARAGRGIALDDLRGRSGEARVSGKITLPLSGGASGASAKLNASGHSLAALLSPWLEEPPLDGPYDLDVAARWEPPVLRIERLDGHVNDNHLDSDFVLRQEERGTALQGRLRLAGKRAHLLLQELGYSANIPDETYMLKADVALDADGSLDLTGFDLQLGRSDLGGELRYQPGAPATLNAAIHADRLDFRIITEEFDRQASAAPATQQESTGLSGEPLNEVQLNERLIPDTPLDLGWLSELQGDLELVVDEVILRDDLRSSGEYKFKIADGALVSEKMRWGGGFSAGSAQLELRDLGSSAHIKLLLESHRLPFIWLFTGNSKAEQKSAYKMMLEGRGATVRDLAGDLNGTIAFKGGGGRMNNRGLILFLGDVFGEVFAQIDPSGTQETHTNLECHGGILAITDGMVELSPGMVLRSDKLDIALGGWVNLDTERLNVVFNTRSRKGVGISASKAVTPYVKLGGNFAHPRIGMNVKGAVVSGGAAVVTGGLSIVAEGMWDRWVATSVNPCEALFEETGEAGNELKKMFGRP
jgi:AsmA family protein